MKSGGICARRSRNSARRWGSADCNLKSGDLPRRSRCLPAPPPAPRSPAACLPGVVLGRANAISGPRRPRCGLAAGPGASQSRDGRRSGLRRRDACTLVKRLNLPSGRDRSSQALDRAAMRSVIGPARDRRVRARAGSHTARPCRRRPDNFLQISVRHHTRVTFFQTPLWSLLIVHIFVMRLVPSSVGPSPSQLDLELLREIAKRLGRPREQLVVVLVVVERS